MRRALFAGLLVLLGCGVAAAGDGGADVDTDGDGLSDVEERHKYLTDPAKADSDGDGKPDGDWDERREYAYTIESRIRVLGVVDDAALHDDYQDARVLERGGSAERTDAAVELIVVHYPLTTWERAIGADAKWRKGAKRLKEYVAPGVTSNWDAKLKRTLEKELEDQGVDLAGLSDRDVAQKVSAWLMKRATFRKMFCTYYVEFPGGKPRVPSDMKAAFAKDRGDPEWSEREQFENELFGRSMFHAKTHGSCTSASVYLQTGLRAAGLPTRTIVAIPVVDASDPAQVEMVRAGVTHHRVRATILRGLRGAGNAFAAHTFNEVHVGGRWVRLNYAKLGQDILDPNYMGLMTHVRTFGDLSEAGLAETWGRRYALGRRDDAFPHSNPYRALAVTDRFGEHADVENPEVAAAELTVKRAYWWETRRDDLKSSWIDPRDGRGYLILEVDPVDSALLRGSKRDFVLRAEGRSDVPARATGNFWNSGREVLFLVPKDAFAGMPEGTPYTVLPADGSASDAGAAQWRVADGVTVAR